MVSLFSIVNVPIALEMAGNPVIPPAMQTAYADMINNIIVEMIPFEFYHTTPLSGVDLWDGGDNYIKAKFKKSPIVTITKIEIVDESHTVTTVISPNYYFVREGFIIYFRNTVSYLKYQLSDRLLGIFPRGQDNIKMTYTYGVSDTSDTFLAVQAAANMLLAAMFLIHAGTAKGVITGGVSSWTVESVQKAYGQQGAMGAEISRYWSMGDTLLRGVAGGWTMEIQ